MLTRQNVFRPMNAALWVTMAAGVAYLAQGAAYLHGFLVAP